MSSDPLELIRLAAWNWALERLGNERIMELTGALEPTQTAVRKAYRWAKADPAPINWHYWNDLSLRDWNARAAIEMAIFLPSGDRHTGPVPEPIADVALSLEDAE